MLSAFQLNSLERLLWSEDLGKHNVLWLFVLSGKVCLSFLFRT